MPTVGLLLLIAGGLLIYEVARTLGASIPAAAAAPTPAGATAGNSLPPAQTGTNPASTSGGSAYSPQVQSTVQQALANLGIPQQNWLPALLKIQSLESGGYDYQTALTVIPPGSSPGPNTPTGLFQVKPATYAGIAGLLPPNCRNPGTITDAICNTEAAIQHIISAWAGGPGSIPGIGVAGTYQGY